MTTPINLPGAAPAGQPLRADLQTAGAERTLAQQALADIADRLLAWSSVVGGAPADDRRAWAGRAGASGDFRPDMAELGRRGDVYGLRELAGGIAARFGATPAQEGALLRALEDAARNAAVHLYGLAGADASTRLRAVADALDGMSATMGGGIDGVTARIEATARELAAI